MNWKKQRKQFKKNLKKIKKFNEYKIFYNSKKMMFLSFKIHEIFESKIDVEKVIELEEEIFNSRKEVSKKLFDNLINSIESDKITQQEKENLSLFIFYRFKLKHEHTEKEFFILEDVSREYWNNFITSMFFRGGYNNTYAQKILRILK